MENIYIQTTHNVTLQFPIASVGDRMLSTLIDYAVFVAYSISIFVLLDIANTNSDVAVYLALIPLFTYHLLMEIIFNGQSLGKMAMNIKVMRTDGTQATLSQYLIRYIFRIVDITLFSGMVAIITIIVSNKGQRLGDMAAGTTVVKLTREKTPFPQFVRPLPENFTLNFENSAKFTENDIKIIASVLKKFESDKLANKNFILLKKTKEKAEEILEIKTTLPYEIFLNKIIDDYNYIHKSELHDVQALLNKRVNNL